MVTWARFNRVGAQWHHELVAAQGAGTGRKRTQRSGVRAPTGRGPGEHGSAQSVFGTVTLVQGPEALLAQRAVARLLNAARAEHPEVQISELEARAISPADLLEATGGSLFTPYCAVVVHGLPGASVEVGDAIVQFATEPASDVCLILDHPGGAKGRGVVDKLRKRKAHVVPATGPKAWELPSFVIAEARRAGVDMDQHAAQALVDAVGSDLRELAGAVSQLASDWAGTRLTVDMISRYFVGRAETSSFAVSDEVLAGHAGRALERLRWAMSCGVPPVLVTSALASGLRALGKYVDHRSSRMSDVELSRAVGVPPWKLKTLARQARSWDSAAVAAGIIAVARADAEVKGAATDPDFALEKLLLTLDAARMSQHG